jgi:HD-GYP domain-containing protein (c-di-GMP phosphodiesterase class II)
MSQLTEKEDLIVWKEKLLLAIFRMVQAVKLYQDNNQLIQKGLSDLSQAADILLEDGPLPIMIKRGRLYIQGEILPYRRGNIQILHDLVGFLKDRRLLGFAFHPSLRDASAQELTSFMRLLVAASSQDNPSEWLTEQVEMEGFAWVSILLKEAPASSGFIRVQREKAGRVYTNAQSSVSDVARRLSTDEDVGVRRAKRTVQYLVEMIQDDESMALTLSTVRDYENHTQTHSVNVALLSMCLGNRIGLSNASLTYLGLSGLFHDLGNVELPEEVLNKPGKLDEQEWEKVKRHPLFSVGQILKMRASHALKSKILLAPFEHHVNCDLSGYPTTHLSRVTLFGRILHIADFYDAITSPRVYRPASCTPDHAVKLMTEKAGTQFDAILLKVFIGMMGAFPVGTVLCLDNGEIGLAMGRSDIQNSPLPRAVLLEKEPGGGFVRRDVVDLAERDPVTNRLKRNIVRSLHPESLGIHPVRYIL